MHICAFISTWKANHSTQRLTTAKIESSKIAELTLALDGPAARWYSRLDLGEFTTFQDVCMKFLELFHREVPKRELLRQFLIMSQEPQETVAQFTIRFQDLYRQLAEDVSPHHIPDTFLAGLREPLRMTLTLTDFSNQIIKQVIARVLAIDRTQHSTTFFMGSLQSTLPPQEDHHFRQALQCRASSGSGHLAFEVPHCPHCPHFPICQSGSHTVEQCEYNVLNRTMTAPVRQIEHRNNYSR